MKPIDNILAEFKLQHPALILRYVPNFYSVITMPGDKYHEIMHAAATKWDKDGRPK
jgi:hypothetical protein